MFSLLAVGSTGDCTGFEVPLISRLACLEISCDSGRRGDKLTNISAVWPLMLEGLVALTGAETGIALVTGF